MSTPISFVSTKASGVPLSVSQKVSSFWVSRGRRTQLWNYHFIPTSWEEMKGKFVCVLLKIDAPVRGDWDRLHSSKQKTAKHRMNNWNVQYSCQIRQSTDEIKLSRVCIVQRMDEMGAERPGTNLAWGSRSPLRPELKLWGALGQPVLHPTASW